MAGHIVIVKIDTFLMILETHPSWSYGNYNGSGKMENWDPEVAKEIKQLESDRRIELLTKLIVDKAKDEVKAKYGNKVRHRQ